MIDVARMAGCNEKTVRRWLQRHGLKTRSMSENAWFRQAAHGVLTETATEIIQGELLGDGYLGRRSAWSSRYQHNSQYREYLVWLSCLLEAEGLRFCHVIPTFNQTKTSKISGWHISSKSYTALSEIHGKWYEEGVKIVPSDLKLTPRMALHWYLGDGCLLVPPSRKPQSYRVRLSTDCFRLYEVHALAEQLKEFSPSITRYQSVNESRGYRLTLKSEFLQWIGSCPKEIESIYGYKWTGEKHGSL